MSDLTLTGGGGGVCIYTLASDGLNSGDSTWASAGGKDMIVGFSQSEDRIRITGTRDISHGVLTVNDVMVAGGDLLIDLDQDGNFTSSGDF